MIRFAWPTLLLLLAFVACAAQLDRQARRNPLLALMVPAPARYFSQFHIAAGAIATGPPEQAMAEARLLVRRRPMPAENLRLLAAAQIAAGGHDAAYLTLQQAARRGWRDSATQEAMLLIALDAGDGAEAARRFAALWVLDPAYPPLPELSARIFADAQARAAMAAIAADAPRWRARFLASGGRVIAPDAFADIAARIRTPGSRPPLR